MMQEVREREIQEGGKTSKGERQRRNWDDNRKRSTNGNGRKSGRVQWCVWKHACERDRQGERVRDRQTDRQTDKKDKETKTQGQRETKNEERERGREEILIYKPIYVHIEYIWNGRVCIMKI